MLSLVTENRTKQATTSSGSVANRTINQNHALQGFFLISTLGVSNEPRHHFSWHRCSFHSVNAVFLTLFRLSIPGVVFF